MPPGGCASGDSSSTGSCEDLAPLGEWRVDWEAWGNCGAVGTPLAFLSLSFSICTKAAIIPILQSDELCRISLIKSGHGGGGG